MIKKGASVSIPTEFQRGRYERVVRETVDRENARLPPGELHWVVGSLSMLGRVAEAADLFARFEREFTIEERIAARFFIAITITRHGRYAEGRALFGKNLREGRGLRSPRGRFFVEQGMGFYRYFSGSPRIAAVRAERAHSDAMRADFLYGRVLALDLLGHATIETSEIATGLEYLERARRLARKLGNGSVLEGLGHSVLLYRTQFGLGGADSIRDAERRLSALSPEDTYTESSILLELSRQYLFRGERARAKEILNRASRVIFATQNRRHEIILNLRFAELLNREGEPTQALNYLRAARTLHHVGIDRALDLERLGIEIGTCRALGWEERARALVDEAEALLETSSPSVTERSLRLCLPVRPPFRARGSDSALDRREGMDPFADLRDRLRDPRSADLHACIEAGYLGLLPEALGLGPDFAGIRLDVAPGSALFFDRGNVAYRPNLPPQLKKVIELLESGTRSKEELIRAVWGYDYHPLRHDTLVYQALNQLRKYFGEFAAWIVTTEEGYGFAKGIRLVREARSPSPSRSRSEAGPRSEPLRGSKGHAESASIDPRINVRQREILRRASAGRALDVRSLAKALPALPLTVSRDLSFLTREGLLVRVGRGRATQYLAVASEAVRSAQSAST